jgi:hypothetical protein
MATQYAEDPCTVLINETSRPKEKDAESKKALFYLQNRKTSRKGKLQAFRVQQQLKCWRDGIVNSGNDEKGRASKRSRRYSF